MIGCNQCRMARRSFLSGGMIALAGLAAGGAMARSPRAGQIVDFHAHMYDPDLPNILPPTMASTHNDAWLNGMRSPDIHIAHMDRCGVDAHVVGYSNAVHGISWGDAADDLKRYRGTNDRIAREWVAAHPGRFHGAFGIPTQDLKLAIPELERAVTTLGMKVLQISSCTADGIYYGDPRMDPLWEAVQHHGVTVFIHPHGQDGKYPFDDFALSNTVGQGVEEIKVMTSMIYNGVFEKFPRLKVVVAHGGGFLPHYYGRMDRNAVERPQTVRNIRRLPSDYLKSFHYDSCVYSPEILAALIRVVGVDRIVLGSDFPVGEADGLASLKRTPGITAADAEHIARLAPSRLLGLIDG